MDFNTFYHDMLRQEKSTAMSYLLLHLLKSTQPGEAAGASAVEQQVNVYLTKLLLSIADPRHIEQTNKFISVNDVDVASMINASTDTSLKYLIYKSNADHLLTLTGLFNDAQRAAPEWLGSMSMDTLIGRGKTYYGFAAAYQKQIHRKVTAVMEVLERLSEAFEHYTEVLQHLSKAYFNFLQSIPPKEMNEFMEQVSKVEEAFKLKELQDQFLDLYSLWLKSPNEELLDKIKALAQRIQEKDPDFKFTPPTHG